MEVALRRDADEAVRLLKAHFQQTLEFGRREIRRLNASAPKVQKPRRATNQPEPPRAAGRVT
jgi:hypothetical protein